VLAKVAFTMHEGNGDDREAKVGHRTERVSGEDAEAA
jgi:hypothetical protein